MPVFLECQRCTACCRWPGQVKLTETEIARLAAFLALSEHDFVQDYTQLRPDRRGLALKDQPDGACLFLRDGSCEVQPAKPQQCRDFPNLWNFPDAEKWCRAIPRDVGLEEWKRLIREATGREAEPG